MQIEISYDEALKRLFSGEWTAEFLKTVGVGMREAAIELTARVQERIVANHSVKSGRLLSSIGWEQPADWTVNIGSMAVDGNLLPYAAQVEFGGTISPTHGSYLAWAVSPEYGGVVPTPSGVSGANASDVDPAEFGAIGTFVRPSKSGKTKILFFKYRKGESPDGTSWAPAFILAPSVTQPGKPYLTPTIEQYGEETVVTQIETALKEADLFRS